MAPGHLRAVEEVWLPEVGHRCARRGVAPMTPLGPLPRALQESMLLQAGPSAEPPAAGSPPGAGGGSPPGPPGYGSFAEQLRLAMALSEREQEERERRRREEDEELQRILRLSLTEK